MCPLGVHSSVAIGSLTGLSSSPALCRRVQEQGSFFSGAASRRGTRTPRMAMQDVVMQRHAEAALTDIEYSEDSGGMPASRHVFGRTPITCLSIFDSMLLQSFVDGSVVAFDLATRKSFPLADTRPMVRPCAPGCRWPQHAA